MAALWESFSFTHSLSTQGTNTQSEVFHNEVDDHIFASAPITFVDGIVTLATNGDDLFQSRLIIAHELLTGAEVGAMQLHEPGNWYRWHITRGPIVFRLRSKRTIPSEHKLWLATQKVQGSIAENVRCGITLLMVRHQ